MEGLKKFVYIFKDIWKKIFKTPSNNVLLDGIDVEENALNSFLKDNFSNYIFYYPNGDIKFFEHFKS